MIVKRGKRGRVEVRAWESRSASLSAGRLESERKGSLLKA